MPAAPRASRAATVNELLAQRRRRQAGGGDQSEPPQRS
jgi:hypothetical protein